MKAASIVVLVVAVITIGFAAPGLAYNTKFCVTMPVEYLDSSNAPAQPPNWELLSGASPERTEDNFTSQSGAVAPRGAIYQIKNASKQVLMSGFLDDGFGAFGAGCTGYYTGYQTPATITVKTNGVIQSNDLGVYLPARTVSSLIASLGTVPQSGPHYVLITPPDGNHTRAWRGYIAGAYALFRHAGGETNNHYQFYICECPPTPPDAGACLPPVGNPPSGCDCDGPACDAENNTAETMQVNADAGLIRTSVFNQPSMSRKFILIHEMGHLIAEFVTNGVAMSVDYSDEDVDGGACRNPGTNNHAFWSREKDKAAFAEAFADFYSADVWNDHNEDNCAFKYYVRNDYTEQYWDGAPWDCAGDDGADPDTDPNDYTSHQGFAQAAYVHQCTATGLPPTDYPGRGTEIDWTRALWNLHTDGSTPPSFTSIARWIRDCDPIGFENAFTRLDQCANSRGASDPLNLNWDVAKNVHSIDYSSY